MAKWSKVDAVQLPTVSKVKDALLLLLFRYNRPVHASEAYEQLSQEFKLDVRQRHTVMEKTKENSWENRVRFARFHLVEAGLVDGSEHNQWKLTKGGWLIAWNIENPGQTAPGTGIVDI